MGGGIGEGRGGGDSGVREGGGMGWVRVEAALVVMVVVMVWEEVMGRAGVVVMVVGAMGEEVVGLVMGWEVVQAAAAAAGEVMG